MTDVFSLERYIVGPVIYKVLFSAFEVVEVAKAAECAHTSILQSSALADHFSGWVPISCHRKPLIIPHYAILHCIYYKVIGTII